MQPDAKLADTLEEFKKGYDDAYEGRVSRPSSVRYLEGYARGKLVAFLVNGPRAEKKFSGTKRVLRKTKQNRLETMNMSKTQKNTRKNVSSFFKSFRSKNRLSQEELSEKLNISRGFLSDLEIQAKDLSVATLVAVSQKLGVTPNEILGY